MKKARTRLQTTSKKVSLKPIELLKFSVKAEVKERPIIFVPIFFLLTILIAAFILRAAEMPADDLSPS